jgi:dienelactone hydrolase
MAWTGGGAGGGAMTRRELFGSAAALAAIRRAPAQDGAEIRYREYARCLPDYLARLAADAFVRRNARIAALGSAEAIHEYQSWARRTFLALAGPLPQRTPLNVRTLGAFDRPRYRLEKLVYESRPGLFVTANLYLPLSGSPPFPGVLFQMGHTLDGKGGALYQRCCQGLVQLGYVVLAFDPMGQGERTNYPEAGGWLTRLRSADSEHTTPGRQMLLTGETATGMLLWDAMRSLDVLASHPQVDGRRLASTGQSGGGTLTMLLAAADDRLAAAAVCSGNTENFATVPFFAPGSTDDAEQNLVGSGPPAFDRWDLLWPLAPKPLLVAASAHDFIGTYSASYGASGREEFRKLMRVYEILGAPGKLKYVETPLPHGLSNSLRLAIYNWFERSLKASDRTIEAEPPTSPEPDQALWCGKTGNAVRDFAGRTPFVLLRERAASVTTPARPPDLRSLLGMEAPAAPPRLQVLGGTRYRACDIRAAEVQSAETVWVPAWLFLPKGAWSRLLLILEPNGRNAHWREDDLYAELAGGGIAVCAADVRGVGDLAPQFSPGAAGYAREHQDEENYAWAGLILGRSLLGQRVTDILALTTALAREYPEARIAAAARDAMTVPALCATALEQRIAKVYLARHLVSWRSLVAKEEYTCPFANFVPDVLRATDLPGIARSIAPRTVIVAGAVDASGRLIERSDAPYENYRETPSWDYTALSQL